MTTTAAAAEQLLAPGQVAVMFKVDPRTVTRWAQAGRLTSIRTLGGHRRFREAEVLELLGANDTSAAPAEHRPPPGGPPAGPPTPDPKPGGKRPDDDHHR
jgi:excisionase family DNA binding protein